MEGEVEGVEGGCGMHDWSYEGVDVHVMDLETVGALPDRRRYHLCVVDERNMASGEKVVETTAIETVVNGIWMRACYHASGGGEKKET